MNKQLITQLALIFVLTQALGLFVGDFLSDQGISSTLITDDPDDVENSVGLIVWILVFTAILLAMLKFAPDWFLTIFLKAVESFAIFGTTIIVLLPFFLTDLLILLIALGMVLSRILFRKNILLRNVTSIISAAGAGALIGASLGVIPIIVFIILLSIYDFIAVFKTKHMVALAKGITKMNLSFTYALPTKKHQFELGTGDLVIPLAFAVSVLAHTKLTVIYPFNFVPSLAILFASFSGLALTLHYASLKKGRALPALPLQTFLMIFAFTISKVAGF